MPWSWLRRWRARRRIRLQWGCNRRRGGENSLSQGAAGACIMPARYRPAAGAPGVLRPGGGRTGAAAQERSHRGCRTKEGRIMPTEIGRLITAMVTPFDEAGAVIAGVGRCPAAAGMLAPA